MSIASAAAVKSAEQTGAAVRPWLRRGRRRPRFGRNLTAIVFIVIWIFPVYWMVDTAFKPQSEQDTTTPQFIPTHATLQNFTAAFHQSGFLQNLRNSLLVVLVAVAFAMIISLFASAALARWRFRGRSTMMVVVLVVQMLPPTALLIPQFLIFNKVGLTGTYTGLILAYVALVLPLSIWILRGFFVMIPVEVEEAAIMDGASTWRLLRSILFPLVAPGVVATSIFAFVSAWNDYIYAYTFMKSSSHYTLPIWLVSFSSPFGGTNYGGQMAASVLFTIPVVVFFVIIQRNRVTGLSAGAVKG
jgi:N,N'-diacetylchitobiose transport system permease protein